MGATENQQEGLEEKENGGWEQEVRDKEQEENQEGGGGGSLKTERRKVQHPQGGLVGNPRSSENCPKGAEQRAP